MGSTPQYSPDGKWWWDGQQWRPAPQPTPSAGPAPRRGHSTLWIVGGVTAGVILLVLIIAGALASSPPSRPVTARTTTSSTAAATQPAAVPFSPLTLTGQGSKVTEPFHLPAGSYRVSWSALGPSEDNFIVHVHQGTADEGLINEIPPNPASGEASLTVDTGDYFLSIQAATLKWSITFTKVA